MEWRDEGIVVGVRRHGETAVVLELLTRNHGRHLGFVHGGRSRQLRPCLQPGNSVSAIWRSRIEDHLGTYAVEARTLRTGLLIESALALHLVNHLCSLARLLPEREPHVAVYGACSAILDAAEDLGATPTAVVRLELALLSDLGFGLDLTSCAATGSRHDLAFVSPKSGRAVSRSAGQPYHDRLLALPAFLLDPSTGPQCADDLSDGFRLTEYFLNRDVLAARGLAFPPSRRSYLTAVLDQAAGQLPGRRQLLATGAKP